MKTIIRITESVDCDITYDLFIEELINSADEIEIFCSTENGRFINPFQKNNLNSHSPEYYRNKIEVTATGYSQGEWQTYTLFHNLESNNEHLLRIISELEKSFTHHNNYHVDKFERVEIDGKTFDAEPHDFTSFGIRHIEFPDPEDIKKCYIEIYGEDFDEIEIDIK